jgi:hypothetical protein
MRTKLRSKISLLCFTLGLLLAIPAVALADNVVDDLEGAATTKTITAGDSFTNNYWIVANSSGGTPQGCDVGGAGDNITATFSINTPTGVSASPNPLTFDECENGADKNAKSVTFTSNTPGTYAISVSKSGGTGTYNTNPSAFTLTVNPAADSTPPVITPNIQGTLGDNGWYTSNVTVTWTVTDDESAITSKTGCGSTTIGTDTAGQTVTCSATSAGGTNSKSVTIKRDVTPPNVSFVGGISGGASYDFGEVPAAPTCSASDETLGLASPCNVTGYSEAVGSHTLKATATDNAGNKATITRDYTVVAWRLSGFYQPVDMNDVVNTVKNGSTVPLKFEVFKRLAGTELTNTSIVNQPLKASQVSCSAFNGDPLDEINRRKAGARRQVPVHRGVVGRAVRLHVIPAAVLRRHLDRRGQRADRRPLRFRRVGCAVAGHRRTDGARQQPRPEAQGF